MKQAIIIRTDLKMGKGKLVAQGAHASVSSFLKSSKDEQAEWLEEGMKKIVLKVSGEKELKEIFKAARDEKLHASMINDAGLTQLEPGTATTVGIGPAEDRTVDKITGKLKLL